MPTSEDSPATMSTEASGARLAKSLREAPTTVPMLAVLVLLVVWETSQAGYPLTHWTPGALIVLALLGITIWSVPLRWGLIPRPVRVAVLCLAAYTALSFLSILWAGVKGDAWEGANRTLLYLLVFALFACWPQNGRSALLLVCGWTLATIGVAAFVALHVELAAGDPSKLQSLLPGGRLIYPAGYANAAAAQWMMAFWPALLLARSERLHWGLRGVLAGGAVLLGEIALLSQSRGSLFAAPAMLALVFVLLPGRVRTFVTLVPVAAGIGAATTVLLHVGDRLQSGHGEQAAVHAASRAMLITTLAVGVIVALGAMFESKRVLSAPSRARAHRRLGALALLTLVVVLVGGLVAAGNPVTRVKHEWDTFTSGSGYAANGSGNRLTSGLGSNRYDFYRVALDQFLAHPVLGIGADNYAQQYLRHGRSSETPKYPHSVELRTISQAGVLGALLGLLGLAAALVAGAKAIRASDPLVRAAAAAALGAFAYWVLHGSVDWFWEFAGLGASAFALLGLACALAPVERREGAPTFPPLAATQRRAAVLGGILLAAACAASLTAPWLSERDLQSAAHVWARAPAKAFQRLHDAARLNPLSDGPYVVAGNIALRLGELKRADREFERALARTPKDSYAMLERGALASTMGRSKDALVLLERAAYLAPRDPLTAGALRTVRRGGKVDVERLNRAILLKAQQLS